MSPISSQCRQCSLHVMSYSDFTIEDLKADLGLTFIQDQVVFPEAPIHELSGDLQRFLTRYTPLALAIDTEKARSEYIVAPIPGELTLLHRKEISLFSGIDFTIDKEHGLSGRCDFIISHSADQYSLTAPVVVMVEAKNDNIKSGIPQCGAEMVAAQRFNTQKQNEVDTIYGCVTTGTTWKFLKLWQQELCIDVGEYYIDTPGKILGMLTAACLGE